MPYREPIRKLPESEDDLITIVRHLRILVDAIETLRDRVDALETSTNDE